MRPHHLRAAAGNVSSAAPIVTSNLACHWDFGDTNCWNQSSTAVTDLTGNGNNGTLSSGHSYSSSNGGYLLSGGSTTLSTNVFRNVGNGPFTIEMWYDAPWGQYIYQTLALFHDWQYYFPIASGAPAASQYITGLGYWDANDASGKGVSMGRSFGGSGQNLAGTSSGSYPYHTTSSYQYFDNVTTGYYSASSVQTGWEQMVFSRENANANGFKVYRNGSNIYTGTNIINYNVPAPTGNVLLISQRNIFTMTGGASHHAYFAIFRIYTGTALTSTDVTQNYNAQKARFGLS